MSRPRRGALGGFSAPDGPRRSQVDQIDIAECIGGKRFFGSQLLEDGLEIRQSSAAQQTCSTHEFFKARHEVINYFASHLRAAVIIPVRPGERVRVATHIEHISVAMADEGVRQPITGSKRCPLPLGDGEILCGLVERWEREANRAASRQRDALFQQFTPRVICIGVPNGERRDRLVR